MNFSNTQKHFFLFILSFFFSIHAFAQIIMPDTSFGEDGMVTTIPSSYFGLGSTIDNNGKIVVVGSAFDNFLVLRYNADGSPDTSFDGDGSLIMDQQASNQVFFDVDVHSSGKIIAGGSAFSGNNNVDIVTARLFDDGELDLSYSSDGFRTTRFVNGNLIDQATSILVEESGKILYSAIAEVADIDYNYGLGKFVENGSNDFSFGTSNGKISVDLGNTYNLPYDMLVQADGKIVVGGEASISGQGLNFGLVRHNANGFKDTSFGNNGVVLTDVNSVAQSIYGIALQNDQKIVAVGKTVGASSKDLLVTRYNTDGSLDLTFGDMGISQIDYLGFDNYGTSVLIQASGKIIVVGTATVEDGTKQLQICRLDANGQLDSSFSTAGFYTENINLTEIIFLNALFDADENLIVTGTLQPSNNTSAFAAKYILDESLTTVDLDNDGFNNEEDCDDLNANINPGQTEIPNNEVDENCDGVIGTDYTCLQGGISFFSQSQVDNFPALYPFCNEVSGDLTIAGGVNNLDSLYQINIVRGDVDITTTPSLQNVEGLIGLDTIGGTLYFHNNAVSPPLQSFSGLNNLKHIGNSLRIQAVKNVLNMDGFQSLETVDGSVSLITNDDMVSLQGFNSLTTVGDSLLISKNNELQNINTLGTLTSVGSSLRLIENSDLSNTSGLNGINFIGGDIELKSNSSLSQLNAFNNLTSLEGGFRLFLNTSLSNLSALQNVTHIEGDFYIRNADFINLDALDALNSVAGNFFIGYNDLLTSFNGLSNLQTVGGYFELDNIDGPTNLSGLNNLESIGGYLKLQNLDDLLSLEGLENIDPNSITDLNIRQCDNLTFCSVSPICDYLGDGNSYNFLNNDDGCSNFASVINLCNPVDNDNDGFTIIDDCNDNNAAINPDAEEIPNNDIDENCDGFLLYIDEDGDGFNSDVDCNDNLASINPSVAEIPNNDVDENCDGIIEIIDVDNDGFNSDEDCDDENANINPDAEEIPNNNIDEDCDGEDATSANHQIRNASISIFPNPTKNNVHVVSEGELEADLEIYLYNMLGNLLEKQNFIRGSTSLNLADYPNGIYLLKVREMNTKSTFIVERIEKIN